MKTAVIYARVSDRKQAEADVSVPAQVDAGRRKAESLGAVVDKIFTDEGRSAYKAGNRPEFEAAIEYATSRAVAFFITWSSARFARNKVEAALFKRELDRAGVRLVYIDIDIDRETDSGWLLDGMLEIFDELRSRQTAVDTRRSMIRNAEQGYFCGGRPPYGYASVPAPDHPKRRKLVPLPEEAARVREIFELRRNGWGAKALADRYNTLGIRYRGRTWKKDTVLHLLRNEAAIGKTVFNQVDRRNSRQRPRDQWIVVDSHEPILDLDLWHAVQADMDAAAASAEARGYAKASQLFTGLIRCQHCDGVMTVETAKGNGGRYSYYVCRRGLRNSACDTARFPTAAMDDFLKSMVMDRVLRRDSLARIAAELLDAGGRWRKEQAQRRAAIVADIASVNEKNSKLYGVLEAMGIDAPNLSDIADRLRANKDQVRKLEQSLADLDAEDAPIPEISDVDVDEVRQVMQSLFDDTASVAALRTYFRSFIQGVKIEDDEVAITYDPGFILQVAGKGEVHRKVKWRPKLDSNQRPPD